MHRNRTAGPGVVGSMNRITIAVSLALIATTASAQNETAVKEPDRIVIQRDTRLDFGAAELEGTRLKPADSYIPARRGITFANLLKIRGNFTPELQQSIDAAGR